MYKGANKNYTNKYKKKKIKQIQNYSCFSYT